MSLRLSSILVALCLGVGFVSPPLPVRFLPINAIEIAQSTSTPTTAEDFVNRGIKKGKKGDLKGAIADYNEAIRLNPNFADAYSVRGAAYFVLGEFQKAIADFNEVLRLNPNFADAYSVRGAIYLQLGESQKAIADLQKAANLYQQ